MSDRPEIWALTDGRAGNSAQAMALAEALGRAMPVNISEKTVTLKRWAAAIPPGLSWRVGAARRGWPFSGIETGAETLHWPWPDLVIGAGRRVGPLVAALRRLHGVPAVQILNPRMPASAFDALIVPRHDGLTGGSVLQTTGALSRITQASIAQAGVSIEPKLTGLTPPRLAVLVGGPSASAGFTAADQATFLRTLSSLSRHYGLMITTSRRTPPGFAATLADKFAERGFVWTGEGENPYPGLLAHADAALVTADSVNMASEAASTGLPVHVFPISGTAAKIAQFHETLTEHGATRRFTGEIGAWEYTPLAEADRVAADLIRWGLIGQR